MVLAILSTLQCVVVIKHLRHILAALILLSAAPALAERCVEIGTVIPETDMSAAGGALTSSAFDVRGYTTLIFRVVLLDVSDSVTKIQYGFTESRTQKGTYSWVMDLGIPVQSAYTARIKLVYVNPNVLAKNHTFSFANYASWLKISIITTGHSAGDTLAVAVHGCYH